MWTLCTNAETLEREDPTKSAEMKGNILTSTYQSTSLYH